MFVRGKGGGGTVYPNKKKSTRRMRTSVTSGTSDTCNHDAKKKKKKKTVPTNAPIQTQRDGSDVTIAALKLAMNLHFPLPKIHTIGDEFTLSLAKNSHFSFLPSHFLSLPSRRGHHCGAEIRNEFTLSIAKHFVALFVPPLSNGTSRATSDRKPKTNDQILPSPILFFPSKKWIKLIPKFNLLEGVRSVERTDLCFAICGFSQVRFITPSHLTHNLFFYFQ